MIASSPRQGAPLRFLLAVTAAWVIGRGAMVLGWRPPAPLASVIAPTMASMGGIAMAADIPVHRRVATRNRRIVQGVPLLLRAPAPRPIVQDVPPWQTVTERIGRDGDARRAAAQWLLLASYDPAARPLYQRPSGTGEATILPGGSGRPPRLSGSAWAFVRGGGRASALSPGGQIGGGQAGARILVRLDGAGRLSAAGRVSTTIGGIRQSEGAAGLDWKPLASLPVHLMVERRIAIDRGGRNAWTAGLAGGVYAVPVAPGWRLDGYAEAGVVGARRRDLYADGGLRIARALDLGGGRSLGIGAGAWGAAQPGTERLDIGPSVVLRLPVGHRAIAVSLDWRERIAGAARPGSGIALTVAADF